MHIFSFKIIIFVYFVSRFASITFLISLHLIWWSYYTSILHMFLFDFLLHNNNDFMLFDFLVAISFKFIVFSLNTLKFTRCSEDFFFAWTVKVELWSCALILIFYYFIPNYSRYFFLFSNFKVIHFANIWLTLVYNFSYHYYLFIFFSLLNFF